jgi:hypothetical protein
MHEAPLTRHYRYYTGEARASSESRQRRNFPSLHYRYLVPASIRIHVLVPASIQAFAHMNWWNRLLKTSQAGQAEHFAVLSMHLQKLDLNIDDLVDIASRAGVLGVLEILWHLPKD